MRKSYCARTERHERTANDGDDDVGRGVGTSQDGAPARPGPRRIAAVAALSFRRPLALAIGVVLGATAVLTVSDTFAPSPAYAITNGEQDGNGHPYVGVLVAET